MRFRVVCAVAAGAAVLTLALTPPTAWTQPKKLVFWTHWEQNPEFNKHQAQGILPVWTANLDSPYVKARPDYQSTQEMLRQPVPPEYYHPKSNELATAFGEAVVAALYGKGQPKPLLDEAAAKMDRALKD